VTKRSVFLAFLLLVLTIPVLAWGAAAGSRPSTPITLRTSGPIVALAADGDRAAVMVSGDKRWRIAVWEPPAHRAMPIHTIFDLGCSKFCGAGGSLALAGTRVGWDEVAYGNTLETSVSTATLARHRALSLGAGGWDDSSGGGGDEALGPVADARLVAFTIQEHCGDPEAEGEPPCPPGREVGDVVSASMWRAARRGRCPTYRDYYPAGHCALVAKANGELTVLAVDAGRIAARADDGVRLMTGHGRRLRDFPVDNVRAAALAADRLALRIPGAIEVYDTGSGGIVRSIPVEGSARLDRLEDFEHGILVTAKLRTVTLRRLRDGHTATIRARGTAHAQLEPPGLFVAGGRRVAFTPMSNVLDMLDAAEPRR
jgi:hypothetical protein